MSLMNRKRPSGMSTTKLKGFNSYLSVRFAIIINNSQVRALAMDRTGCFSPQYHCIVQLVSAPFNQAPTNVIIVINKSNDYDILIQ